MSSQVCPINYIPKVDSREFSYSYKKNRWVNYNKHFSNLVCQNVWV